MDTFAGQSRRLRLLAGSTNDTPLKSALRIVIGVLLLGAGAAGAALFMISPTGRSQAMTTVEGTWELSSVGGAPAGPDGHSVVLWQRLALRGGKIRGETLVSSVPDGAVAKLPFPDDSVEKVVPNADETGFRVLWSGTYQIDEHRQLTAHIGNAVYFVKADLRDSGQTLEFNQDIILTLPGTARYRHAASPAARRPLPPKEPFSPPVR